MKNNLIWIFSIILLVILADSCKKEDSSTAYDDASAANGGLMYDKFWIPATGFDQNHADLQEITAYTNFFRCKQCHGWDQFGRAGSYIGRAPSTTRPNVASLNLADRISSYTADQLFDAIKSGANRRSITADLASYDPATNAAEGDKMPDYGAILTDGQIWDLVKFLKEGRSDPNLLYDATTTGSYPTGSIAYSNIGKNGISETGKTLFQNNCSDAACHGNDGTALIIEGYTLGEFLRNKPYEVHHKIKFGQPGTVMPAQPDWTEVELKDIYIALTDEVAFP